jgi:HK97 family phage prohead protease
MSDIERRYTDGIEVRQDGVTPRLVGYAAMFGVRSLDLGGFVETIKAGAFARSLKSGTDVLAFFDHDSGRILGRRSANTLILAEDSRGLRVEITPPEDSPTAREVFANVKAGNLRQMSFGFRVPKDGDTWDFKEQPPVRELLAIDLAEVSVVAMPAYPQTEVALRAMAMASGQRRPTLAAMAAEWERKRASWR